MRSDCGGRCSSALLRSMIFSLIKHNGESSSCSSKQTSFSMSRRQSSCVSNKKIPKSGAMMCSLPDWKARSLVWIGKRNVLVRSYSSSSKLQRLNVLRRGLRLQPRPRHATLVWLELFVVSHSISAILTARVFRNFKCQCDAQNRRCSVAQTAGTAIARSNLPMGQNSSIAIQTFWLQSCQLGKPQQLDIKFIVTEFQIAQNGFE